MAQRVSATDSATRQSLSIVWIGLLGPLTINKDGQSVELSGPKRRALLTLLSLHIDDPLGREQIIEALWPRRQTGREDSTLRVHISHLRDELEPDRKGNPKVLVTRGQAYMLSGHVVDTDLRRFDELVGAARQHIKEDPGIAVDLLDEALKLWRGRALQDVEYEEFAQDEIRRLDRGRVGAIRDRAEAMIAIGEDAAAIQDLEPLVRDDPTDEGAVALLMRALYRTGRQSEALRVASRLTRQLRDRGLEPSPHVVLLEEQIINHDPGLLPEGTLAPGEIKPGRSVRGYELREETGRGSIGVVYRAFQPAVGRGVAVKVINPDLAQSSEFVRRFGEEAKVIAGLEHPHIVPLHDFWREPGGAFLVMRWMDGGSLADRLSVAWEVDRLARVFDQVAAALGYAHSCGVVHRDVKPENILFDSDDNAYLCDFGLAAAGIETGVSGSGVARTAEPPYAAPEVFRGEGPTVASDVFGLGVLLAEAASGVSFPDARDHLNDRIWEVVNIATATNQADRYPDIAAFRTALQEAIGDAPAPAPKTVRRNPYKGLEPFDEIDNADFYGRDDAVESLLDAFASRGLVALIGASGSGKSSVVRAGLIPQLRDGALPGSEQWSIVTMYPGDDPFEEFRVALRDAAVGPMKTSTDRRSEELRELLLAALDSPTSRALLAVDQFEELFSSSIEEETRSRFLDNLVDLASDHVGRFRVVLTMRADFSDRPLAHPTFGDLVAKSSLLLGPMRQDELEDVIRRPAARVGIQVEPGLISEIIRDVADAPGYLPLLQYVLAELFERRSEDRLTVQAYRSLGGVQGVVERRAEATFASLDEDAKAACRQLFLRMVHLGDHGEETRRRLPLNEVAGLGARGATETALEAFASARLIAYDRDPVSRTPTVEVAHETVIDRWTRYRVWIDEARTDLLAQRRVSASAQTWVQSGEDPAFLLTGGPLNEALELVDNQRVDLNKLETRFVEESREAARAAEERESTRRQHEADLEQRSRRRLGMGIGIAAVAVVIAVLAVVAWDQRQRASDIAAMQERESLAREVAALSVNSLSSADSDLSLLLAIASAEETLETDGEIVPEATDAMHRALINPRPAHVIDGAARVRGGKSIDYSRDGSAIVALADDGGAMVVDPATGEEMARIAAMAPPAVGVEFHPLGRVMTIHGDAVREWDWRTGEMLREMALPEDAAVTSAAYSKDGSLIAIGSDDGLVYVVVTISGRQIAVLEDADLQLDDGQEPWVHSLDFDPTATRLVVSSRDQSRDGKLLIWDLGTNEVIAELPTETPVPLLSPLTQVAWQPAGPIIAGITNYGETLAFNGSTGERFTSYGNGNFPSNSVAFDSSGALLVSAGGDGVARAFGTMVGGEAFMTIPSGGVPLHDAAFIPARPTDPEVATVGADGNLLIWRNMLSSELPTRGWNYINPRIASASDADVYVVAGTQPWYGIPVPPMIEVIDAETNQTLLRRNAFTTEQPFVPAINADGSRVAYVGPGGDIMVADVSSGATEVVVPRTHLDLESPLISERGVPGVRLALSSDGSLLAWAGASRDGVIRTWDVDLGEPGPELVGHGDRRPAIPTGERDHRRIEELAFHPGSSRVLVSIGHDGTVRSWDIVTGEGRLLTDPLDYPGHSLAFSSDAELLAISDRVGTVEIVDADTGEVVVDLEDVSGPSWLAFSPDGKRLLGGGPGPFVHVWDLESGLITRRLRGSVYWPNDAVFINGGRQVLVMSTEGVMRGYHLSPEDLLEAVRDAADRSMTEEECRQYLGRPCDD